jgi:hypothetical protein
VEDQATDRSYRIGQTRNVQVHKLITMGTLEEKIDAMLESKRDLADRVVGTGEGWLTELDDDALRRLVVLEPDADIMSDDEPNGNGNGHGNGHGNGNGNGNGPGHAAALGAPAQAGPVRKVEPETEPIADPGDPDVDDELAAAGSQVPGRRPAPARPSLRRKPRVALRKGVIS